MTEGKRILFAIPWGERTIIGTTTPITPLARSCRRRCQDVQYVLQITNQFFPAASSRRNVISTWAGLRPLMPSNGSIDISRSHEIRSPSRMWTLRRKIDHVRLMAEQTVNQIAKFLKALNESKREFSPCRTAENRCSLR